MKMSLRDENGKLPVLTVKHLLGVAGLAVSLTFGMFTYEAGRAMDKLEAIGAVVTTNDKLDAVQEARLGILENRQTFVLNTTTDHEKRITILEVEIKAPGGRPNFQ